MAGKAMFSLAGKYQTADEIDSGSWFTLDSGLEVRVARGGSPEFFKVAARAAKKFGRKRGDIPPEKTHPSLVWTLARANFKEFRTPDGAHELEAVCGDDVEVIQDSEQGRERLLTIYPDLQFEVMELAGKTADEFQTEIDEAGKG
jgi:hypothetical protein